MFHLQIDDQTKRQNSMMETYSCIFVNKEQNDWANLLPMTEFVYNNTKNTTTGHIPFELYCGYYSYVLFKEISIFT